MTSDKPSHDFDEQSPEDLPVDAIPVLEEALESESYALHDDLVPTIVDAVIPPDAPDNTEAAIELSVDLGYAEDSAEETDDLADMEEIQTLPLEEMVLDDPEVPFASAGLDDDQKRHIATLEAIVFEGDDPTAPAPKYPAQEAVAEIPVYTTAPPAAPVPSPTTTQPKPLPIKSDNPFLPQHILDRLNAGKRNLVEEIAQSGAALDASTAILRTHARAERLNRPAYADSKPPQHSFTRDKSTMQKQKIVEDLVEEYLPLLAAELRRRLRRMLEE